MKKIVFAGGGTLGPVTPLLATVKALRVLDHQLVFEWIGTPNGPERVLIQNANITFHPLTVAKVPRYMSLEWFAFPFRWAKARMQARTLIKQINPDAVVTVGGFTAVPVVYAAKSQNTPCVTHQLDFEPGLANKAIAKQCISVTTSFQYETNPFETQADIQQIPTPVRFTLQDMPSRNEAAEEFGLNPERPTVLVFGGGTGAQALNEAINRTRDKLLEFTQVLHVTGTGKGAASTILSEKSGNKYVSRPFLDKQMLDAYACADVVIARAGLGTMSELSALQKPAILLPIPQSHQEANASMAKKEAAALILDQNSPTLDEELIQLTRQLLSDAEERLAMARRWNHVLPTDDGSTFAKRILRVSATRG